MRSPPSSLMVDRLTSANSTWSRICSGAGASTLFTTGIPWVSASSRAFRMVAASLTCPERTTEEPVLVTLRPAPGKSSSICRWRDATSAVTSMV